MSQIEMAFQDPLCNSNKGSFVFEDITTIFVHKTFWFIIQVR